VWLMISFLASSRLLVCPVAACDGCAPELADAGEGCSCGVNGVCGSTGRYGCCCPGNTPPVLAGLHLHCLQRLRWLNPAALPHPALVDQTPSLAGPDPVAALVAALLPG